ncbi:uncharacterized protein LOC129793033 [Lutzomyia longipalpis]|uniref:uncharacterized protein LOC129793033 n=1 Tax=Lutzomyia longipalpis TaxID=7200 RepID=UPI00248368D1|nr:uncharacterized protein LOC129793033 [Lutzomyia longipalpis]
MESSSKPPFRRREQKVVWECPAHETKTILNTLNNDCLFRIMSYLNLRELLIAEEVCMRFKIVAEMVYRTTHTFNSYKLAWCIPRITMNMPRVEALKIMSRVGPYINTLTIFPDCYSRVKNGCFIIPLIAQCRRLETITLRNFSYFINHTIKELSRYLKRMKIKSLDIHKINDEQLITLTENMESLEELSLACNEIDGECLIKMQPQNVRNIYLSSCSYLEPVPFKKFCRKTRQLEKLIINDCNKLDDSCLHEIPKYLKNLKTLIISNTYRNCSADDYLVLADLPELTNFAICFSPSSKHTNNVGKLLLELSTQERIKHLNLERCTFTNDIKYALGQFKHLHSLRLYDCKNCSDILQSLSCTETIQFLDTKQTDITLEEAKLFKKKCKNLRSMVGGVINFRRPSLIDNGERFHYGCECFLGKIRKSSQKN